MKTVAVYGGVSFRPCRVLLRFFALSLYNISSVLLRYSYLHNPPSWSVFNNIFDRKSVDMTKIWPTGIDLDARLEDDEY